MFVSLSANSLFQHLLCKLMVCSQVVPLFIITPPALFSDLFGQLRIICRSTRP